MIDKMGVLILFHVATSTVAVLLMTCYRITPSKHTIFPLCPILKVGNVFVARNWYGRDGYTHTRTEGETDGETERDTDGDMS